MKLFEVGGQDRMQSCVQQAMEEAFSASTVPLDGSIVDLEDILISMREITAKKRDVAWQQEEEVLNGLMSNIDELYLPNDKELLSQIDQLEDTILNPDDNIMGTVSAVQKYARLLSKHTTTEDAWYDSDDGKTAYERAQEGCDEQNDSYGSRGVSPRDFF